MSPTGTITRCGGVTSAPDLPGAIVGDPDLWAFYRLAESSGTLAADSGPYALHLSATGVPVWGAPAGPPGTQAADFAAWYVDRATGFATLAGGDMTAEAWIYRTSGDFGPVVGQSNPIGSVDGWALTVEDTTTQPPGRIALYVGDGSSLAAINGGGASGITVGAWYYIATTRTTNLWRLYVNGIQQVNTLSKTTNVQGGVWIGQANGLYLHARTSFVAIYSRALSGAEILDHYTLAVP